MVDKFSERVRQDRGGVSGMGTRQYTPAVIDDEKRCVHAAGRQCGDECVDICTLRRRYCDKQYGYECGDYGVAEDSKPSGHGIAPIMRFRGLR